MSRPIIKVGINGKTAEGEEFDHAAAKEMVDAGYMINRPVILEYPDGIRTTGNQVRITPAGLEFLRGQLPPELIEAKGNC